MQTIQPDPASLHQCLQQEISLVSAFIKVLEHEAEVLADGARHDALTSVTTQKNNYAEQLGHRASERNAILKTLGYGIDKDGLKNAVRDYPELSKSVNQLLEQTSQASVLNTGNGRIITRFLSHNQEALDILQHLTGRSDLYNASGRKQAAKRSHATLIKAT